jgi:hypothetical protein
MIHRLIFSMDAPAKFWSKVQKSDGCWEWTGLISVNGYGRFIAKGPIFWAAHRYAWALTNGAIPEGRVVMHACDNRKCVNPAHLSVGTQSDNLLDASRKGRLPKSAQTHCIHGHAFTPENVYLRPRGGRTCLPCRRAYNSARKKRLRADRAVGPSRAHGK